MHIRIRYCKDSKQISYDDKLRAKRRKRRAKYGMSKLGIRKSRRVKQTKDVKQTKGAKQN